MIGVGVGVGFGGVGLSPAWLLKELNRAGALRAFWSGEGATVVAGNVTSIADLSAGGGGAIVPGSTGRVQPSTINGRAAFVSSSAAATQFYASPPALVYGRILLVFKPDQAIITNATAHIFGNGGQYTFQATNGAAEWVNHSAYGATEYRVNKTASRAISADLAVYSVKQNYPSGAASFLFAYPGLGGYLGTVAALVMYQAALTTQNLEIAETALARYYRIAI
jgi:hypothetical protein